jgi:hyperosmotically inducible protein
MKRTILVALGTGAVISSAAALGIGAAVSTAPNTMTKSEYDAALSGIQSARVEVLARCDDFAGADKDICLAEAGASELVRVADIEESFRRTHEAAREAQRARIDARYQVSRAKCQALGGVKRDKCLISTHATRGRALLDAQAPYELRN